MKYQLRNYQENKTEVWKDIPNYKGYYQVSNLGRVRSLDRFVYSDKGKNHLAKLKGKVKKLNLTYDGYPTVHLCKQCKNIVYRVHRIVAQAFIVNENAKPHVNHKNGIKTDNRVENLEWCTLQENIQHALENGLTAFGIKSGKHKLTEEQVLEIRAKYIPKKYSQRRLAKEYGITRPSVQNIINRDVWKHI